MYRCRFNAKVVSYLLLAVVSRKAILRRVRLCTWSTIINTHVLGNGSKKKKMWPVLVRVLGRYGIYIAFPFSCAIGIIGYNVERWVSDRYTPPTAPITQQRQERLLDNIESTSVKVKHSPLDFNLSPSLST